MELIRFEKVCKSYQTGNVVVKALDQVSFHIEEGEFVIIIGDSGSGKSTLLNLLGGMDQATSGQIFVNQKDISLYANKQLEEYRRECIGFIFQSYNLIYNLNVLENIELASEHKKNHLASNTIIEKVGLKEKINAFPTTLSGGEAQRVAIARAIVKDPLLLLCDEPTGALDYENSKNVMAVLQEMNREFHKTIVLITHNQNFVPLANRVIVLKSGKIKETHFNPQPLSVNDLEW